MINILWDNDINIVRSKFRERLDNALMEYTKDKTRVLLLLSSGESFEVIKDFAPKNLSNKITISVLDEKYSANIQNTNYYRLSRTRFFSECVSRGCLFINPLWEEGDNLDEAAKKFQDQIKHWMESYTSTKIIITQDIEPDGSTAGLYNLKMIPPQFQKFFKDKERFISAYITHQENIIGRFTANLAFLKEYVDESIIFVSNKDKTEILKSVLLKKCSIQECPSLIIHEMKKVNLFTDIKIT